MGEGGLIHGGGRGAEKFKMLSWSNQILDISVNNNNKKNNSNDNDNETENDTDNDNNIIYDNNMPWTTDHLNGSQRDTLSSFKRARQRFGSIRIADQ